MTESIRILIIDDEAPARDRMRELLADCASDLPHVVVGECANGYDALALLGRVPADLALVDIHMPQMSGLEFARHALNLPAPPAIVFVTAHDQYAVQAFEVNALDYLLKPVRASRLATTIGKVAKTRGTVMPTREVLERIDPNPRRHLSVAEHGRILLVPAADILYLKAELKYVTVRTRAREYLIEESLAHLEQEFGAQFMRIHRNCLVAVRAVRGFERAGEEEGEVRWAVLIEGSDEKLMVSRRQWPLVKALAK
jgi:two-component system, LytTR family, response regulator AlgR